MGQAIKDIRLTFRDVDGEELELITNGSSIMDAITELHSKDWDTNLIVKAEII